MILKLKMGKIRIRDKVSESMYPIKTKKIMFMLTVTIILSMDRACRSSSRTKAFLKTIAPRWPSIAQTTGSILSLTTWSMRAPSSKRLCRMKTSAVFVSLNRTSRMLLCRRVKEVKVYFLSQWSSTSIRFLINSKSDNKVMPRSSFFYCLKTLFNLVLDTTVKWSTKCSPKVSFRKCFREYLSDRLSVALVIISRLCKRSFWISVW